MPDVKHNSSVQIMVYEKRDVNMKNIAWTLYSEELNTFQRKKTCSEKFLLSWM